MPIRRPVILITGFGPFPGVPENATTRLVPELQDRAKRAIPGHRIVAEILPTEWRAAPIRVEALIGKHKPVATVHFGVSSRAEGFVVETRGRNAVQDMADACGERPMSNCIVTDGPEVLASTFPASLIVSRLRRRGLPAALSRDAGLYLCNAVLYRVLALGRGGASPLRSGFIHLPDGLAPRGPGSRLAVEGRGLTWEDAVEGGLEILAAVAGHPSPGRHG